ncbi:methyltransferase [Streptomyces durocortorensis]|uniref:O-methyltransferase C-terminal domain-containing protein n=1 Tax=Streptomyces durocortorensis TaxID=2811104 RepID=A0ABS2HRD3_9ACTN|nr:methyltransferase [Streptomyces durocortorensis]MBM7052888.1 hypothetical protein [Streptomyces durocortorensis]
MTDRHDQVPGNGRDAEVDWQARGAVSRLVLGQMATQALGTAVRLGVFDRIGAGESSADALAGSFGTHPQATLRLLRAAILRRIREVIPAHGSLLIVEPVLPATVPADPPGGVYLSDLNMLVNVGGRERTAEDFAALCTAGGFALRSVTPLPAPNIFQIIEASPA